MLLMNQIMPLLKFEILCFCPWWKKLSWGAQGKSYKKDFLSPSPLCFAQGAEFINGGGAENYLPPFGRDSARNENISALPTLKIKSASDEKILDTPLSISFSLSLVNLKTFSSCTTGRNTPINLSIAIKALLSIIIYYIFIL